MAGTDTTVPGILRLLVGQYYNRQININDKEKRDKIDKSLDDLTRKAHQFRITDPDADLTAGDYFTREDIEIQHGDNTDEGKEQSLDILRKVQLRYYGEPSIVKLEPLPPVIPFVPPPAPAPVPFIPFEPFPPTSPSFVLPVVPAYSQPSYDIRTLLTQPHPNMLQLQPVGWENSPTQLNYQRQFEKWLNLNHGSTLDTALQRKRLAGIEVNNWVQVLNSAGDTNPIIKAHYRFVLELLAVYIHEQNLAIEEAEKQEMAHAEGYDGAEEEGDDDEDVTSDNDNDDSEDDEQQPAPVYPISVLQNPHEDLMQERPRTWARDDNRVRTKLDQQITAWEAEYKEDADQANQASLYQARLKSLVMDESIDYVDDNVKSSWLYAIELLAVYIYQRLHHGVDLTPSDFKVRQYLDAMRQTSNTFFVAIWRSYTLHLSGPDEYDNPVGVIMAHINNINDHLEKFVFNVEVAVLESTLRDRYKEWESNQYRLQWASFYGKQWALPIGLSDDDVIRLAVIYGLPSHTHLDDPSGGELQVLQVQQGQQGDDSWADIYRQRLYEQLRDDPGFLQEQESIYKGGEEERQRRITQLLNQGVDPSDEVFVEITEEQSLAYHNREELRRIDRQLQLERQQQEIAQQQQRQHEWDQQQEQQRQHEWDQQQQQQRQHDFDKQQHDWDQLAAYERDIEEQEAHIIDIFQEAQRTSDKVKIWFAAEQQRLAAERIQFQNDQEQQQRIDDQEVTILSHKMADTQRWEEAYRHWETIQRIKLEFQEEQIRVLNEHNEAIEQEELDSMNFAIELRQLQAQLQAQSATVKQEQYLEHQQQFGGSETPPYNPQTPIYAPVIPPYVPVIPPYIPQDIPVVNPFAPPEPPPPSPPPPPPPPPPPKQNEKPSDDDDDELAKAAAEQKAAEHPFAPPPPTRPDALELAKGKSGLKKGEEKKQQQPSKKIGNPSSELAKAEAEREAAAAAQKVLDDIKNANRGDDDGDGDNESSFSDESDEEIYEVARVINRKNIPPDSPETKARKLASNAEKAKNRQAHAKRKEVKAASSSSSSPVPPKQKSSSVKTPAIIVPIHNAVNYGWIKSNDQTGMNLFKVFKFYDKNKDVIVLGKQPEQKVIKYMTSLQGWNVDDLTVALAANKLTSDTFGTPTRVVDPVLSAMRAAFKSWAVQMNKSHKDLLVSNVKKESEEWTKSELANILKALGFSVVATGKNGGFVIFDPRHLINTPIGKSKAVSRPFTAPNKKPIVTEPAITGDDIMIERLKFQETAITVARQVTHDMKEEKKQVTAEAIARAVLNSYNSNFKFIKTTRNGNCGYEAMALFEGLIDEHDDDDTKIAMAIQMRETLITKLRVVLRSTWDDMDMTTTLLNNTQLFNVNPEFKQELIDTFGSSNKKDIPSMAKKDDNGKFIVSADMFQRIKEVYIKTILRLTEAEVEGGGAPPHKYATDSDLKLYMFHFHTTKVILTLVLKRGADPEVRPVSFREFDVYDIDNVLMSYVLINDLYTTPHYDIALRPGPYNIGGVGMRSGPYNIAGGRRHNGHIGGGVLSAQKYRLMDDEEEEEAEGKVSSELLSQIKLYVEICSPYILASNQLRRLATESANNTVIQAKLKELEKAEKIKDKRLRNEYKRLTLMTPDMKFVARAIAYVLTGTETDRVENVVTRFSPHQRVVYSSYGANASIGGKGDLPKDVHDRLMQFVEIKDRLKFKPVNHQWNSLSSSNRFKDRFGISYDGNFIRDERKIINAGRMDPSTVPLTFIQHAIKEWRADPEDRQQTFTVAQMQQLNNLTRLQISMPRGAEDAHELLQSVTDNVNTGSLNTVTVWSQGYDVAVVSPNPLVTYTELVGDISSLLARCPKIKRFEMKLCTQSRRLNTAQLKMLWVDDNQRFQTIDTLILYQQNVLDYMILQMLICTTKPLNLHIYPPLDTEDSLEMHKALIKQHNFCERVQVVVGAFQFEDLFLMPKVQSIQGAIIPAKDIHWNYETDKWVRTLVFPSYQEIPDLQVVILERPSIREKASKWIGSTIKQIISVAPNIQLIKVLQTSSYGELDGHKYPTGVISAGGGGFRRRQRLDGFGVSVIKNKAGGDCLVIVSSIVKKDMDMLEHEFIKYSDGKCTIQELIKSASFATEQISTTEDTVQYGPVYIDKALFKSAIRDIEEQEAYELKRVQEYKGEVEEKNVAAARRRAENEQGLQDAQEYQQSAGRINRQELLARMRAQDEAAMRQAGWDEEEE